ncbi:MAG: M13 family metallopeptidase [Lachnospiraceae bacterium]|nr:M13 family metallopeptidase [Lachnospiraceae bacterium]
MSETTVRIQDDLYEAVNGEWLKAAVIPDDKPTTGGFATLAQNVEETMMADFKDLAEGKKKTDITEMHYAIELYKKVLDTERRTREGIAPVLPVLEQIKALETVDDLNKVAAELLMKGRALPLRIGVSTDMKDATKHSFIICGPNIILPDTTYYAEGHEAGQRLLGVYSDMVAKLLRFCPLTEEEQKTFLEDTLAFDALVAKKVKSRLEWSEYYKNYNPMDTDEVAALVAPFDLKKLLSDLYGEKIPSTIIVYDPRAIKEMNGYFSAETFKLYAHWLYVKALLGASRNLSPEMNAIGRTYGRALSGIASDPTIEKEAFQTASGVFSEPVGVYYGRTYFGEEAKKDVEGIVQKIIDTYKLRIRKNTFLAEPTKEKAIKKLSTIEVKIGYPDTVREIYSKYVFDESDSYYDAIAKIDRIDQEDLFDKLYKPVDRTEWPMPGHMVNACYSPYRNDITFPAAILQKPFYSLSQTVSENLGGIGAVIGHEISHAFDNNGAKFDENGNLNNWWLEEDFAAFKELTGDMIKQFDGIEFHGGKVNGELTVSENIADNGGLGVTIEIMHTIENSSYKEFFMNWARVWCMKAKEEYIRLRLTNDVHSPNVLRANMAPRNFPEWYEAFGVTDKDKMYIAPEKRISIW